MYANLSFQDLAPWLAMTAGFIGTVWAMAKGYQRMESRALSNEGSIDRLRVAIYDESGEFRFLSRSLYKELQLLLEQRLERDLGTVSKLIEDVDRQCEKLSQKIELLNNLITKLSVIHELEAKQGGKDVI